MAYLQSAFAPGEPTSTDAHRHFHLGAQQVFLVAIFSTLSRLCEGVATSGPWASKLGTIVKEVHNMGTAKSAIVVLC